MFEHSRGMVHVHAFFGRKPAIRQAQFVTKSENAALLWDGPFASAALGSLVLRGFAAAGPRAGGDGMRIAPFKTGAANRKGLEHGSSMLRMRKGAKGGHLGSAEDASPTQHRREPRVLPYLRSGSVRRDEAAARAAAQASPNGLACLNQAAFSQGRSRERAALHFSAEFPNGSANFGTIGQFPSSPEATRPHFEQATPKEVLTRAQQMLSGPA